MELAESVGRDSTVRYSSPAHVSIRNGDVGTLVNSGIPEDARQTILYLARSIRDEFIQPSIQMTTTRAEYVAFWSRRWQDYMNTAQALHVCIDRAMSADRALTFGERSVDELNDELRKTAVDLAGEAGKDELDFAVSTMKRAFRLVSRFRTMDAPENRKKDAELARRFSFVSNVHSMAAMSLALVGSGLRPNSKEVLDQMFDYLRGGALEAYAIAREAYDLRSSTPSETIELPSGVWDSDDAALAEATADDAYDLLTHCRRDE